MTDYSDVDSHTERCDICGCDINIYLTDWRMCEAVHYFCLDHVKWDQDFKRRFNSLVLSHKEDLLNCEDKKVETVIRQAARNALGKDAFSKYNGVMDFLFESIGCSCNEDGPVEYPEELCPICTNRYPEHEVMMLTACLELGISREELVEKTRSLGSRNDVFTEYQKRYSSK